MSKVITGAGALLWRLRRGKLEVLLVHRPGYQDWSWPKGKPKKGECLPAAAVREVAEETGYQVRLGIPLAVVSYRLSNGRQKKSYYWAAQVLEDDEADSITEAGTEPIAIAGAGRATTTSNDYRAATTDVLSSGPWRRVRGRIEPAASSEIDKIRWMSVKRAAKKLTYPHDREPLFQLRDAHRAKKLATRAIIVVRHGRAKKRSVFTGPEAQRPLTPKQGKSQAQALVGLFAAYGVNEIHTSPWQRCADTVAPYAQAAGITAKSVPQLTEAAHAIAAQPVRELIQELLVRQDNSSAIPVICLHRPVLATVIAQLQSAARGRLRSAFPQQDPWLKPGQVLVGHISQQKGRGRIVAVEVRRPAARYR